MKIIKKLTPVWVVFADGEHLGIYDKIDDGQHLVWCKEGTPPTINGRLWPDEKVFLKSGEAAEYYNGLIINLAAAAGLTVSRPNVKDEPRLGLARSVPTKRSGGQHDA